jgi:hypothetical protein
MLRLRRLIIIVAIREMKVFRSIKLPSKKFYTIICTGKILFNGQHRASNQ